MMPLRPFGAEVDAAARAHALAAFPEEACGIVVNNTYVALTNIAENPRETFEIASEEMLRPGIQAIVHSHPNALAEPSAEDMEQQLATGLPWGIVATDGTVAHDPMWWGPGIPIPPLVGRDFRHGPSGSDGKGDCYALIRDWYLLERGIELPEFPRGQEWWHKGGDLYRSGFAKAGFRVISIEDIAPGDVLLMQIQSPVPNHGAIFIGEGGLLLHHLANRLSRKDPLTRWLQFVTHALRHESQS
jgi:cell wall-associated NlpC family hydrolase